MYCFLCHLALVDVGFTSNVVPPLLAILRGWVLRLELAGCLVQLCASLALRQCVPQAVLALDHVAARALCCDPGLPGSTAHAVVAWGRQRKPQESGVHLCVPSESHLTVLWIPPLQLPATHAQLQPVAGKFISLFYTVTHPALQPTPLHPQE